MAKQELGPYVTIEALTKTVEHLSKNLQQLKGGLKASLDTAVYFADTSNPIGPFPMILLHGIGCIELDSDRNFIDFKPHTDLTIAETAAIQTALDRIELEKSGK